MKQSEFRKTGTITIGKRTDELWEGINIGWFKFGKRHIRAKTREEAIAKLEEEHERRETEH